MSLANETTTIDDLCDDLLCQIFDRLPVKQVLGIQRVNHDFNRSAKIWYTTVDKLNIREKQFFLSKTNKPFDLYQRDGFDTSFDRINRMLDIFTQIKDINIFSCSTLSADQLVHLVSRCPNLKQISINFCKLNFDDTYWTCLVELIKHCDIHLTVVTTGTSLNLVQHLEQLFATAKKVKTVKFFEVTLEAFMTIAGLDESAEVSFVFALFSGDELTDDETRQFDDFASNRVDTIKVFSQYFHYLPARFSKLSQLEITVDQHEPNNLDFFPEGFECPNLKRLTINDRDRKIISEFFAEVPKMEHLEQLKISSYNFKFDEDQLNVMLEKAANISKLEVAWKLMVKPEKATLDSLVKLFRLLSLTLPRLRTLTVDIHLELISADHFKRLLEPLVALAEERPEVRVKLEFSGGKEYSGFKRITENMPGNVQINWALVDR